MIFKDGSLIGGKQLRDIAISKDSKIVASWDGGAFRETLAPADIEDCDVFKVSINYGHEVQFILVSSEDRCIITICGVVGECKEFLDENGILQPAQWIMEC